MKRNKRMRSRCEKCFWSDACNVRTYHDDESVVCTHFIFSPKVEPVKKPNLWLYFAGDLAFSIGSIFLFWIGTKFDYSGAFVLCGAFAVFGSNVLYEYRVRLRDYMRYIREVEHGS